MVDIIAIDGPASVGKSSLAKKISFYYNSPLLNSGKLYRAVAFKIQQKKVNIGDRNKITKIAKSLSKNDLNSKDLFNREIDKIASKISTQKYLRDQLLTYQKEFPLKYAKNKKFAIIEGRDIATVVFPKAKYKIFVWADPKIRAKRRNEQIKKNGGNLSFKRVYNEICARDKKDFNRSIAPLKPDVNSVLIDTSYLDIEQVFNVIKKILLDNKI